MVAALNRQIEVVGRTVRKLRSTDVRYRAINRLSQPDRTQDWMVGAGNDRFLMDITATSSSLHEFSVGFFADDCQDVYVMVQNANHTDGNFPTVLDAEEDIRLVFDFSADNTVDATAVDVLNKETGQVERLPMTTTGAMPTLDITLAPGDVFFYKYRTGNPFVQ